MAARAEGQARVDDQRLAMAGLCFGGVPAGQDEQPLADRNGVELRLGDAHPVLVVHPPGGQHGRQGLLQRCGGLVQYRQDVTREDRDAGGCCRGRCFRSARRCRRVGGAGRLRLAAVEQHGQPGALPAEGLGQVAVSGAGQAGRDRFAKERLLVGRVGIGVFGLHRQGAGLQQGIGPGFGLVLVDFEGDFGPGLGHGICLGSLHQDGHVPVQGVPAGLPVSGGRLAPGQHPLLATSGVCLAPGRRFLQAIQAFALRSASIFSR